MEAEIILQIILSEPTKDVDFGLQKGSGSKYQTVQKQRAARGDMVFKFPIKIKGSQKENPFPKFSGDFVQGPTGGNFIYIDIGTYAGQTDTCWSRRLKIPLKGIEWKDIHQLTEDSKFILEAIVPGRGKDGSPNCATVKPFDGWHIKKL